MKSAHILGSTLLILALSSTAQAQEYARVISSTALQQQVAVTHEVCNTETVTLAPRKSGAGALLGAIAGGAIGNQLGRGFGNAVATVGGIAAGAAIGDRIEGEGTPQQEQRQVCTPQTTYETHTLGYQVVYEYSGRQYSIQMPRDPGATLPIRVTPVF